MKNDNLNYKVLGVSALETVWAIEASCCAGALPT